MPADLDSSFTPKRLALAVALALSQTSVQAAVSVTSTLSLGELTDGIGLTIPGKNARDESGRSVSSAGDINGDGFDDIIVGAWYAYPFGIDRAGESYVVFGSSTLGSISSLALTDLDGTNGFSITGNVEIGLLGHSVSTAGDINGDGIDDLIVSAPYAGVLQGGFYLGEYRSGESYVVFGANNVGAAGTLSVSDLNGTNGFKITGYAGSYSSGFSRTVGAAGDINGDGIDDLIIGTPPGGFFGGFPGRGYLIFGKPGLGSSGNLAFRNGSSADRDFERVTLFGEFEIGAFGTAFSAAGDINGDGLDDLIAGDRLANSEGIDKVGKSYVLFGSNALGTNEFTSVRLSQLDGTDGFALTGKAESDFSGSSVSAAGDVNGDGIDDLIIGAPGADPKGRIGSGESYVVFGGSDVGSSGSFLLADLTGVNGFTLTGAIAGGQSGYSVSGLGDVNGDEADDLLIGAPYAGSDDRVRAGDSYVVFGGAEVGSGGSLALGALDGKRGFAMTGKAEDDHAGFSVNSAGDVNGDGINDLIIGARSASPGGMILAGESYVVLMPLPDTLESTEYFQQSVPLQFGETQFRSLHPADVSDVMELSLTDTTTFLIETANDGTAEHYDTVLELFSLGVKIDSNDDISPGTNPYSRIITTLNAGTYSIAVKSKPVNTTSTNNNKTIPSYALTLKILDTCDLSDAVNEHELKHNRFELLSLPCQPPPGIKIKDLFGDDIDGEYFNAQTGSGTWRIFTWDPVSFHYVDPGVSGSLEVGQGFWIIQAQTNGDSVSLDLPAGSVSTHSTGAAASACESTTGCLPLPLSGTPFPIDPVTNAPRLTVPNLLGNPYNQASTTFDDLRVTTTLGSCSISSDGCSPAQATLPASGGANVLGDVAFTFNPDLGSNGEYEPFVSGSKLSPWQGFWVFELPAATGNNPVVRFPDLRQ